MERRLQTRRHQVRLSVNSTVCTVSRGFKLVDRESISSENHDGRTFPKVHVLHQSLSSEHHAAVPQSDTSVLLFHTQRDSVSAQAPPSHILGLQTRRRRASQGIVDTTTIHHQSSRNSSRFRLSVSQIQVSEQNVFQAQTYVDNFVIAVCRCLILCCK